VAASQPPWPKFNYTPRLVRFAHNAEPKGEGENCFDCPVVSGSLGLGRLFSGNPRLGNQSSQPAVSVARVT